MSKSISNMVAFGARGSEERYKADLATERERQLTTASANQTTGLTNGTAVN